jgi:hypothetical protein
LRRYVSIFFPETTLPLARSKQCCVRLIAMEEMKTPQPESREFYRQRAVKMLKLAQRSVSQEARKSFLMLAAGWDQLAQRHEERAG